MGKKQMKPKKDAYQQWLEKRIAFVEKLRYPGASLYQDCSYDAEIDALKIALEIYTIFVGGKETGK